MELVTIITPVYNRVGKIHRPLESVKRQSYRNIEHIIIDDGSTDNIAEVIEEYKKNTSYPIVFIQKQNGGKHSAINKAWKLAKGDYIVHLDSDDELVPNAIDILLSAWRRIPKEEYNNYWCVEARCKDQITGNLLGDQYPENINRLSFKEAKKLAITVSGEKIGMMRTSILKNYSYPEHKEVNFVIENVIWGKVNKKYRTLYLNDIVRIYYINEGSSLSTPVRNMQFIKNSFFVNHYKLMNIKDYEYNFKVIFNLIIKYKIYGSLVDREFYYKINKSFDNRIISFLATMLTPFTNMYAKRYRKNMDIV